MKTDMIDPNRVESILQDVLAGGDLDKAAVEITEMFANCSDASITPHQETKLDDFLYSLRRTGLDMSAEDKHLLMPTWTWRVRDILAPKTPNTMPTTA